MNKSDYMTDSTTALQHAVHQNQATTLMGLQQRLFSAWFNSFIYNQIWEDPVVDLKALQIQSDSRVLTIASGSCNILNYLIAQPAHITAIDLNPYHLNLTRLKLAALKYLPDHKHFYHFFGHAQSAQNIDHYELYIRPQLEDDLEQFWQGRSVLGKRRIRMFQDGLYRHARFGYFMRLLHWIARRTHYQPTKLLSAHSLYEQEAIFKQHIAPFFDNRLVRFLGKLPMSVFSLGIPPQQYEAMKREGNLLEQYRARVKRLACEFPIKDNYFAWQAFSHSYDHTKRQAIPDYLKAEHYQAIKQQLGKVDTQLGSMITFLKQQPNHSYDRFVFLDAQDWMSDEVLNTLWVEVLRVGKPNSRIVFRTAAVDSPLETALKPDIKARIHYEKELSTQLFQQDRSAIYGGFHVYHTLN
jgi:S-adenosylmethionine-diacylglycerol 3-amino-3-carboxypropyl transferase